MAGFCEVFDDVTKQGTKIPSNLYLKEGTYPIIDQGQADIVGYTDITDGLFTDVPAIIFGDHTRIIKYVDVPCFLGADGVKLLKAKSPNSNYKYLYYALCNAKIPDTGYNRHFKWLKEVEIRLPPQDEQQNIVIVLDKLGALISLRKQQLAKLDELVKARFVEMFGDLIQNSLELPTQKLGQVCLLKAGITTPADAIHNWSAEYPIPCYGGNGIRGYVKTPTQSGIYPVIGRQGALCGNVQLASGEFHATEHAVLVTPLVETNITWLFNLLKYMDLHRYHTGAAQPGLAVKTLNEVTVPWPGVNGQNRFAVFSNQIDKCKLTVRQSLDKLELLKKSLVQQYFEGGCR